MSRRAGIFSTPAMAGVLLCAVLLAGCASPQMSRLDEHWPQDLPARIDIADVPFYPQEDYECGPAALAMLLQAAGVAVTPEQLLDQVYLPGRKGSLQVELLAASRRHGLPAYLLQPRMEDLLREVAAGHPVLVLQNLSLPVYPVWHYAVVIGYDRERNRLRLHSGRTPRLEMSLFAFERTWARGGSWAMLALAPEHLPVTAEPQPMTESLAALERVQPHAAGVGYATALQRWPTQRGLLLGSGNVAYTLGDLSKAESAYSEAVRAHPDFADAWNNLAQVLLEQGKRPQALQAIERAIQLGGPRRPKYLELKRQLETP
jgi:hypothetical protein